MQAEINDLKGEGPYRRDHVVWCGVMSII